MTQGFIAKYPELIARLAKNGLVGVLSGYETNDADALEGLRKRNTLENNIAAAKIMQENGIISTGIFMVRPDFEEKDFKALYSYIEEIGVALPLVTILTTPRNTAIPRTPRQAPHRGLSVLRPAAPHLGNQTFTRGFLQELCGVEVYLSNQPEQVLQLEMLKKRWHLFYTLLPAIPGTIYRGYRYQKIPVRPPQLSTRRSWNHTGNIEARG